VLFRIGTVPVWLIWPRCLLSSVTRDPLAAVKSIDGVYRLRSRLMTMRCVHTDPVGLGA
jgi:hypothetical protein